MAASVLGGTELAAGLTLLFTCLAGEVEILQRSRRQRARNQSGTPTRMRLSACITGPAVLYVSILFLFNLGAVFLASIYLPQWYPRTFQELGYFASNFVYALAGVFCFEVVMANTNIIVFNKGILAFQNWIAMARDPAVAATIEKQAERDSERQQALAHRLEAELPEDELDTYISDLFEDEEADKLKADAARDANPKLYKALGLARHNPIEVGDIFKARNERGAE